ncbi:hypothetical protein FQZ97_836300 [compost metagenome]
MVDALLLCLQAPAVEAVALQQMVLENAIGPDAEAGTLHRLDAIADGNDDVEAVMEGFVGFAVRGSSPEIPDNCRLVQLPLMEDVADMFTDRTDVLIEQLRHLPLGQPDGFPFQAHLGEVLALMLVDQYG